MSDPILGLFLHPGLWEAEVMGGAQLEKVSVVGELFLVVSL